MSRPSRIKEGDPHRLVVEGSDDLHSIIQLTKRHGCDWDLPQPGLPYVYSAGGAAEVLGTIVTSVKSLLRLGIVLDADTSVAARWDAVRARFLEARVELPLKPDPAGTVVNVHNTDRRIGVWLMPSNDSAGKLEDFLATLIPKGDGRWAHAQAATKRARELGAPFKEADSVKAEVHAWLAWQEEPGRPLGTAITAKYFEHDSSEAVAFVGWFRRLFLQ